MKASFHFVCFLYLTINFASFAKKDKERGVIFKGCYVEDIENPFLIVIPSGIDLDNMTPDLCTRRCRHENFQFAGLSNGKYCKCGKELSGTTVDESSCVEEKENETVSVYEIIPTKIEDVNLTVVTESRVTTEPVVFDGFSGEYFNYFSFGDETHGLQYGEPYTEEILSDGKLKHFYNIPGTYSALVEAQDQYNNSRLLLENFYVASPLINVTVQCPSAFLTSDNVECNLTVVQGSRLEVLLQYGDEEKENFTLPDANFIVVGQSVPQVPMKEFLLATNPEKMIILKSKPITNESFSCLFEAYVTKGSKIKFMVLQFKCPDGKSLCAEDGLCRDSCPKECKEPFETARSQCGDDDEGSVEGDFDIRHEFQAGQEEVHFTYDEWQYIRLETEELLLIQPGDKIAFEITEGKIATKELADETGDLELVDGKWVETNRKYFASSIIITPLVATLKHEYKSKNNYTVSALVKNDITEDTISIAYINIMDNLEGLIVSPTSEYYSIDEEANVTFYLQSGSEANFTIFVENESMKNFYLKDLEAEELVWKSIPFDKPGTYNVTVTADNGIESVTNSCLVIIQIPVRQNEWTTNFPKRTLVNREQQLNIKFEGEDFPTDATAVIEWGDDTSEKTSIFLEERDSKEYFTSHTYLEDGNYTVTINISNMVSWAIYNLTIEVLDEIINVTVELWSIDYSKSDSNKEEKKKNGIQKILHKGKGKMKNTFTPPVYVYVKIMAEHGNVQMRNISEAQDTVYELSEDETKDIEEIKKDFNIKDWNILYFEENGIYHFQASACNVLQCDDTSFTIKIGGIMEFQIDSSNPYARTNKMKSIPIDLMGNELDEDATCLRVDYGDNSDMEAFGEENLCQKHFPKSNYVKSLQSPYEFSHLYEENGNYTVIIDMCGDFPPCINASSVIQVVDFFCVPSPKAVIMYDKPHNRAPRPDEAIHIKRSNSIRLRINNNIENCSDEILAQHRWQIFRVDEETNTEHELEIKSDLRSWNYSYLYVHKNYLESRQLYKISYSGKISPANAGDFSNAYRTKDDIFIRITASGLIPVIISNSMFSVSRGPNQTVTLEPQELSIDPDDPNDQNFTVEWICIRKTESVEDVDFTQLISVPASTYSKNDEGCFGTGSGYLNMTYGAWVMSTSILYPYNGDEMSTYQVTAVIGKDSRTANSSVFIELMKESQLMFGIACKFKERCHLRHDGVFINVEDNLTLSTVCLDDCDEENKWIYLWKAFLQKGEEMEEIEDAHLYFLGKDYEILILNELFKRFKEETKIIIQLEIYSAVSERSGIARRVFIFNNPPYGGICAYKEVTEPPLNEALFSHFLLTCENWEDDEDEDYLFTYKVFVESNLFDTEENSANIQKWLFNLYFGYISVIDLYFPCRNLSILVEVEDSMEAYAQFPLGSLELHIPPDEKFHSFLKNDWMKYMYAIGDQMVFIQKMIAVTSVMECNGNRDNSKNSEILNGLIKEVQLMNLDSSEDITFIGSVLATLVKDGRALDVNSKDNIINIIDQMSKVLSIDSKLSPNQVTDITTNTIELATALMTATMETVWNDQILPLDFTEIQTADYDTSYDSDIEPAQNSKELETRALKRKLKKKSVSYMRTIERMLDQMLDKNFQLLIFNEEPRIVSAPLATATFYSYNTNQSKDRLLFGDASFSLPSSCDVMTFQSDDECNDTTTLEVSGISWNAVYIPGGHHLTSLSPNTKTVSIDLYSKANNYGREMLKIENYNKYFQIGIPLMNKTQENNVSGSNSSNIPRNMRFFEYMYYHMFRVEHPRSIVAIQLMTYNFQTPSNNLLLYLRHEKKPTFKIHDYFVNLVDLQPNNGANNSYTIVIDNSTIQDRTGPFYIGIAQLQNTSTGINSKQNITKENVIQNFTDEYFIDTIVSGCFYYDVFEMDWKNDGCYVASSSSSYINCHCNHLTTFGGGLFVMPNTIDFSYVFANASFTDNLTIYLAIAITLFIYVLLLIWARRKDKKDLEKLGAIPLADNKAEEKYIYEILVFTGNVKDASTDSKVSFVLTGDDDETEIRKFPNTGERKIFRKNGVDIFVMTVPRPLGQLQLLRLWHDNSGIGSYGSWYLDYVIVRDVQTGEKFEFIVNRWFALEKEDGQIDRTILVANAEQLKQFSHLFRTTSNKKLSDGHLWFSVFLRPPRSRFTRCQRISSCMALLYLFMVTNAMWYGTVPEKPTLNSIKVGPLNITLEQISIGFFSNLIVFPVSSLIVFLFRKSRLRHLRPSRIDTALRNTHNIPDVEGRNTKVETKYQRKKSFTLPWWCFIIAWILCLSCIAVSVFFLWAYGIQFGNTKTRKWIASLFIAFFSSLFITQPIKVFFTALILASICKKIETDEDDADEDELEPHLKCDEEWLSPAVDAKTKKKPKIEIPEELRHNRLREAKMWKILREIFGYLIFLWVLSVVVQGVRSPNSFLLYRNLYKEFIQQGKQRDFTKISNITEFSMWTKDILIPGVRPSKLYNGKPTLGWMGFLKDGANKLLGPVIIRQIRKTWDSTCSEKKIPDNNCRKKLRMPVEDTADYFPRWKKPQVSQIKSDIKEDISFYKPFRYSAETEHKTSTVLGNLALYSPGGYVYEMVGEDLTLEFDRLLEHAWIDRNTKAILIEFSTYNPAVDLFAVIKLILEANSGGSFSPFIRINTVRLLSINDGLGNLYAASQIVFVLFLLFYSVRQLMQLCREGKSYFTKFWNWMELIVILLSVASLTFYILKTIILTKVLSDARAGNFWKPVDLPRAQMVDECFCYTVSFVMFFAIVKFTRLLRYNTRVTMLTVTIRECLKNLKGFALFFLIAFLGFCFLFAIKFSTMDQCQNLIHTFTTLFCLMLNNFEFSEYVETDPFAGPIFFFIFAFSFNIIIINLFLSIIIASFEMVKKDLQNKHTNYSLINFIVQRISSYFGWKRNSRHNLKRQMKFQIVDDQHLPANQLPEKVDLLLNYVNTLYFDGKMDLGNSALMKMYKKRNFISTQQSSKIDEPVIFNSN